MASNQNDAIFSTAAISGLSVNQRLHFQSPLFVLCCSSFGLFPISSLSFVTNARMLIGLWCANTVLLQESISYWWVTCEKKSISVFCIILTQCTWRHQGMTRTNFVFPVVFKRNWSHVFVTLWDKEKENSPKKTASSLCFVLSLKKVPFS